MICAKKEMISMMWPDEELNKSFLPETMLEEFIDNQRGFKNKEFWY